MENNKVVLCGANSYEKKYYFNEKFVKLPKSIQEELHIICILYTEEVGGIFTISFDEEGLLILETESVEQDYLYDDISAGLLIKKIQSTRQELFGSLTMYYKAITGKLELEE
jgi:hypothetical protein